MSEENPDMSSWVNDANAALLTDLYELTMLQSYFDEAMNGISVFDLFVRRLPSKRNYLITCGLEHVLDYLESLSFSSDAIEYLRLIERFSEPFLNSLHDFRFTGDVYAVAEGTPVFAGEPLIEVVAPLPEAQVVETFLMNQIQIATLAASKAARVVYAARGRPVMDFGLRRIHGVDAGLKAARAFHIAGIAGTSNVLAGRMYGIPVSGTVAHSYIQAFDDELEAFRRFVRSYPDAILLVDTYDTIRGVQHVIQLAAEMGPAFRVRGIRLDSGNLRHLAQEARRLLDGAGLRQVQIFASSSLDEYAIDDLLQKGAPIDGFGVGARMGTSEDVPYLDTAYKLAEYAGHPRMKLSEGKSTLPGRKQIFREKRQGKSSGDVIALADETLGGELLLVKVMENGRRLQHERLDELRARCRSEVLALPEEVKSLSAIQSPYSVELGSQLMLARSELVAQLTGKHGLLSGESDPAGG